jgi:hypothetical protein
MKSLKHIILGSEFQQGVRQAVEHAVAQANAAGLPEAYIEESKPDFSPDPDFPVEQAHGK